MNNSQYKKQIKEIIFQFINPEDYEVFLFGSRASKEATKFSDYDIGIIGKNSIPPHKKVMIEEALEESDIPYKVDLVDFSSVSSEFKKIASSNIEKI